MSDLADRIGGWAAERVMRWIAARAEGTHREWVAAMRAEMACMDDGVERLRWTLGGVVMAWRMGSAVVARPRVSFETAVKRNLLAAGIFAALNVLLIVIIRANGRNDPPDLYVMALISVGILVTNRIGARFVTAMLVGSMAQFAIVRAGFLFGGATFELHVAPWVAATVAMWLADPTAWSTRHRGHSVLGGCLCGFILGETIYLLSSLVSPVMPWTLRGPLGGASVNLFVCALIGALAGRVLRTPERRVMSV